MLGRRNLLHIQAAGTGNRLGGADKRGFLVRKKLLLISANQVVVMPRSQDGPKTSDWVAQVYGGGKTPSSGGDLIACMEG